jgi:hypothetical protein
LSKILYKNNNELVAGGYDNIPLSFKKNGKTWYKISQLKFLGIKDYEGCKMKIIRNLVHGLSHDKEMQLKAKSRRRPVKWSTPHFNNIT